MISVVMPVYNGEVFLREAVDSVLNQTYRDFEFIIVNDGSTDSTPQILAEYAAKDARVKIIDGAHAGLGAALNLGIEQAQYPWIARMDADDICLPERFEKQLAAAEKMPEVVVWGSYINHINGDGKIMSYSKVGPASIEDFERMKRNRQIIQVMHPTALMKTEIVRRVGGYKQEYVPAEDVLLFEELAQFGPILAVPESLLLYRVHGNSVSMTKFFVQRKMMRFAQLRIRSRADGKPLPTLEEYAALCDQQTRRERFRFYLQDLKAMYYRRAGMAYGNRNYVKTAWYLSISVILGPESTTRRVWNQVFAHRFARVRS